MVYRLKTPIDSARIDTDLGTFHVRGGALEVEDKEVAEALRDRYAHLHNLTEVENSSEDADEDESDDEPAFSAQDYADPDEDDPVTADADEAVCGVEMSSGEPCERSADECPYHGG